jgi:hypothetical protein
VKDWRAVVPSSPEQQIEPERIRGAQEAVARGNALPHDIGSAGILILAVLAIVYTLYFGKEILLPIALALVLKLLCNLRCVCYTSGFGSPEHSRLSCSLSQSSVRSPPSVSPSLSPHPVGFKRPLRACRC